MYHVVLLIMATLDLVLFRVILESFSTFLYNLKMAGRRTKQNDNYTLVQHISSTFNLCLWC